MIPDTGVDSAPAGFCPFRHLPICFYASGYARFAFYSFDNYVVVHYNGARNETQVTMYRNDNFYEPSTDAVVITDDGATRLRGNKLVIKEQEKGK